jgi:RNA polymerase sigma-70 factor (ECF subfamily)
MGYSPAHMDAVEEQYQQTGERAPSALPNVAALIKEHYYGLQLLLLKKTRNPETAADILNGAIAKTLEHLKANRISNPEQIAGWVYRVALNDLRNHRRNMNTRGGVSNPDEVLETLSGEGDASDGVVESKLAALVRQIIEQLPTERDRIIIKRYYLDEANKEQICREQGNLSTLHFDRVIHRARQRMKDLMEKQGLKRTDFFLMLCAA